MITTIRWRADSEGAEWQMAHAAPAQNGGFTECGRYLFQTPGPEWLMRIDDEPMRVAEGFWVWEPGFYAGEVTAELQESPGSRHSLFLFDVAPSPEKAGREAFREMLDDLRTAAPDLLVGSEPATTRMGQIGSSDSLWVAFARLRRYGPEFLQALKRLQSHPRRALHARRTSAPLNHVRRVDRTTALALARSPIVGFFAEGADARPDASTRLDVPIVEETLDCAANRTVAALLFVVLSRASGLLSRLAEQVEKEQPSATSTPLAARWPVRLACLTDLRREFRKLSRQLPFSGVTRPEVTAAGLNGVAADPIYARAWDRGWRALGLGLGGEELSDRLWMSPSWEVYESWCFVRLGQMLATSLPDWRWTRDSDRWIGANGGRQAELILQPVFPSRSVQAEGRWSLSRERVPDLALVVDSEGGKRFLLLDAKYRTSRANVLDAMASAHIYQDSLRIGPRRPEASVLLVPAAGGAPWLESAEFHRQHRVGVHALSPGATGSLPGVVTALLS